MTPRRVHDESLRPDRLELSRLFWAIAVSIVFHLLCFGGYELGKKYNVWEAVRMPVWLQKALAATAPLKKPETTTPAEVPQEIPLMFVDVNPQLASPEPPEAPKFYSSANSEAANAEMDRETGAPKITGEQTEVVKAEDVDRSKFQPLQPAVPRAEKEQDEELAKPLTPKPAGDLAIAKPETESRTDPGTAERARPRRLREVDPALSRNQLTGQKMKQDGGVQRLRIDAGFDAKASPLGDYDLQLIEAVSQHWYDLLDNYRYSYDRYGKVVVSFRLHHDGKVTNVEIVENTADERREGILGLLCLKAISDPAPYLRWPAEVRRMMNKDYRDTTFTFNYR